MNTKMKHIATAATCCLALTVALMPDTASAVVGTAQTGGISATLGNVETVGKTIKDFIFFVSGWIVGPVIFLGGVFMWKKRSDMGEQGASQYPWGKIGSTMAIGLTLAMAGILFGQLTTDMSGGKAAQGGAAVNFAPK